MNHQKLILAEHCDALALDLVMPLPLHISPLDVFQLTGGRADLAVNFLEELIAGKLELELPPDFKTSKWLFEQQVECSNRNRLQGGYWLWFGFPLIQYSDYREQWLAPLWLWPLSLRAPAKPDKGWVIRSTDQVAHRPNPRLDQLFRDKFDWDHIQPWWSSQLNQPLDLKNLSALINGLIDRLKIESPSQSVSLSPWSEVELPDSKRKQSKLLWSGLIGNFPPDFPRSNPDAISSSAAVSGAIPRHPFGLLSRDPWQESAFQAARNSSGALVSGTNGTGKTTLLVDMLVNALSNGERCLVVSDRMESLRQIHAELTQLGLDELTLFLQRSPEEQSLIRHWLKKAATDKKKESFPINTYTVRLQKLLAQKKEMDEFYQAVNKPVLGPYTWTQTVGLYLAAARMESKALLGSQLNAQDFPLSYDQYQAIHTHLGTCQALFEELKTLNHPLTVLNAGIFVHQDQEEARQFINTTITEFTEAGAALQYRYIVAQNDYGDQLVDRYEQQYRQLSADVTRLQEKIAQYRRLYGKDPLESTKTTLKLYGRFSTKFRKTLAAKEDLATAYQQLELAVKEQGVFSFDFLPEDSRHLLSRLQDNLQSLQIQLQQWREQLSQSVQEEMIRLSSKTVHPELAGNKVVGELEDALDLWIGRLNDSGLLQLPLENKTLTVARRQRFLEEVVEKLDRIRFNMRDFDRFYQWQRHWFGLPAEARRIISALVKVKPADWSAAFSSWYLHQKLLQTAESDLTGQLPEFEEWIAQLMLWRKKLVAQIQDHWQEQRQEQVLKLKKEDKKRYEQLTQKKGKDWRGSSDQYKVLISPFFPVVLTSPYFLEDTLADGDQFDRIFVEEAQTLDLPLLETLKTRGRQTVLFVQPDQSKNDLKAWARRQGWAFSALQGQYAQKVEEQVDAVGGRYNSRQQINDEEARKLLSLLNVIEETPQRTLPRVAIVCLTRAQRNLLVQYMDRIKKHRMSGVEKIQQLERNGMGVYVPDEIPGLKADVLILSCTFGPTDIKDKTTGDLEMIDRCMAPGLTGLLRTRATKQTLVLHSIPASDLTRFLREKPDANSGQLAAWLLSLEQPGSVAANPLLRETPTHPLAQEIGWHIADQVRTDRLAFNLPFGPANIPMTVAPLGKGKARAVLLNGFLAETPAAAYEWERDQQRALEIAGYELHPVWAAVWWKRADEGAAKFLATVNAVSDEEE